MITLKGLYNWFFFRNSFPSSFHTYKDFLVETLLEHKPKKILKWGTGNSTLLMSETLPDSEIHSIEGDRRWMLRWILSDMSKNDNIFIHYIPVDNPEYESLSMFSNRYFDFVFSDAIGSKKEQCLLNAKRLVRNGGHIMTHDLNNKTILDAVREHYPSAEIRMDDITALIEVK